VIAAATAAVARFAAPDGTRPAPVLTTRQVAATAAEVLPEVRARRLLFWRYLLIWQKPLTPPDS